MQMQLTEPHRLIYPKSGSQTKDPRWNLKCRVPVFFVLSRTTIPYGDWAPTHPTPI